jgi:hypothetical protein
MKESYSVYIVARVGPGSYLSHKGRTSWCRKTAQKYINELLRSVRYDTNVSHCILENNNL